MYWKDGFIMLAPMVVLALIVCFYVAASTAEWYEVTYQVNEKVDGEANTTERVISRTVILYDLQGEGYWYLWLVAASGSVLFFALRGALTMRFFFAPFHQTTSRAVIFVLCMIYEVASLGTMLAFLLVVEEAATHYADNKLWEMLNESAEGVIKNRTLVSRPGLACSAAAYALHLACYLGVCWCLNHFEHFPRTRAPPPLKNSATAQVPCPRGCRNVVSAVNECSICHNKGCEECFARAAKACCNRTDTERVIRLRKYPPTELYHLSNEPESSLLLKKSGWVPRGVLFTPSSEGLYESSMSHTDSSTYKCRVLLGRCKDLATINSSTLSTLQIQGFDSGCLSEAEGTTYVIFNWDQVVAVEQVPSCPF